MKVTKEKSAQNRASLVKAASRLFRERGVDGVGVAEIGKAAGLTHGALYAQFATKEELAAEAMAHALALGHEKMVAPAEDGRAPNLGDFLDRYVSRAHRDRLGTGCPMAASASETGRGDKAISERYAAGFEQMAELLEAALGESSLGVEDRERALVTAAGMIGAIAVARATRKARPDLSEEVLRAARRVLGEMGGEAHAGSRAAGRSS